MPLGAFEYLRHFAHEQLGQAPGVGFEKRDHAEYGAREQPDDQRREDRDRDDARAPLEHAPPQQGSDHVDQLENEQAGEESSQQVQVQNQDQGSRGQDPRRLLGVEG